MLYGFTAAFLCIPTTAQKFEKISINAPRPIAEAVEMLEQKYGWVITYEDPEYTYAADLKDVTAIMAGRRALMSAEPVDPNETILVPVGGRFEFKYRIEDGKPEEEPLVFLRRMAAEYAAGAPGWPLFQVEQRGNKLHVFPLKARNRQGHFVQSRPILGRTISIPRETRSANQMFAQIIAETMRVSGRPIRTFASLVYTHRYLAEYGCSDLPARECLENMFEQISYPLESRDSWRLIYDPGRGAYTLTFHWVRCKRPQ
ncbi:MAG: hypothetical protein ACE14M_09300 [Terriglobales bacterium]